MTCVRVTSSFLLLFIRQSTVFPKFIDSINHSCVQVEAVTHKLVVFEQIDIEAEGEEEFVLLKQRATYVDVQRVRKMFLQNLESKYTEKALWQKSVQHFENGLGKKK